jgi:glycosyltransferase involved in cell wall biosynthesis
MISVIIPLYNKASTIVKTVQSVLTQTHTSFELVVIDDGSTDNGIEQLSTVADPRVRVIRQANAGVAAARNRGAQLACSEWVAFLDADDLWEPNHLENLVQLRTTYPDAVLYATAYSVLGETGRKRPIRLRDSRSTQPFGLMANYFEDILAYEHPINSSSVMLRRDALQAAGGFPVGVQSGEDLILWARLACAGAIAYSRTPTSLYRLPPVSAQRSAAATRRPQQPDPVRTELLRLQAQCERLAPSIQKFRGEWHRIRAMIFLELGARIDSLHELTLAVRAAGLRRRDIASAGLLILPIALRRQLLSQWRLRFGRT